MTQPIDPQSGTVDPEGSSPTGPVGPTPAEPAEPTEPTEPTENGSGGTEPAQPRAAVPPIAAAPAPPRASAPPTADPLAEAAREGLTGVRAEVSKAVVGQEPAVTGLVISLLCQGHVLLEGVPGVAKTLLIRSLAAALDLSTTRV
jgi:MoxR-like ATPase